MELTTGVGQWFAAGRCGGGWERVVGGGMEFRGEGFSWQKNKRSRECGCQWSAGQGNGDGVWVNRRR